MLPSFRTVSSPFLDARDAAGDLAGHEGLAAAGALVVEEDPVAGVDAVGLAVVHRDPVGVQLGHRVGAARIEGGGLPLRDLLDQSEQFGGRGLVEARLLLQAAGADRLQQAERPDAVDVGGVLGLLEAHRHMAHRAQVVDLVGLDLLDQSDDVRAVGQVAEMRLEPRVLVDPVDAAGVERAGPALQTVDEVALLQQQFCQIGSVLSGDAGDEGDAWLGGDI
jgi:hypothetical protein